MRTFLGLALLATCAAVPLAAQTAASATATSGARQVFDAKQAKTVIERLATALEENFVFPETGKAYAARLRQRLAAGAYGSFPDGQAFASKVSADLQAVHPDGHLRLLVVPPEDRAGPDPSAGGRRGPTESMITKSGWIADGVAYIDFRMFPGNEATLSQLRSFLDTHRDARTLIIDARQHRGGGLDEMDIIFPEIFTNRTSLVQMDTREAVDRAGGNPLADLPSLALVKGPAGVVRREHSVTPAARQGRLARAKVYLLTSKRTASAAEHLALSLKRTKRGTLIGETTRGAGHYGMMLPMDDTMAYAAFIPVGRTFDPSTNEGWEGIGVKPDVAVPADKALDEALKLAGVPGTGEAALAALR